MDRVALPQCRLSMGGLVALLLHVGHRLEVGGQVDADIALLFVGRRHGSIERGNVTRSG